MSKKYENTTEAELEAEFVERNNNLKHSWNNIIDKVDHAAKTTHDYLEAPELKADIDSTADRSGSLGAFNQTGTGTSMHDGTRRRSSIVGEQTSRTSSGFDTSSGWKVTAADHKLMHSIYQDIHAMHSIDPEEFEGVASKFDETFGSNALV